jgi:C-terminal processing protease CtpA/Prc
MLWSDGFARTYSTRLLEARFAQLHALRHGSGATHELELGEPGEPRRITAQGRISMDSQRTWIERYPGHVWPPRPAGLALELRDEGRIALLTVGTFADRSAVEFFARSFRTLREQGTRGLVLDLRWNGGGYDELGALLCRYLIRQPFRFYERLTWRLENPALLEHVELRLEDWDEYVPFRARANGASDPRREREALRALMEHYPATHPLLVSPVLEPREDGFHGQLVVLINGRSSSSGAEVPSILHANRRGVFVGEESGGSYQGVTAGILTRLTLPASRIGVQLPLYRYYNSVDAAVYATGGLQPEHAVRPEVEDILAGQDPVLERAFELLREAR